MGVRGVCTHRFAVINIVNGVWRWLAVSGAARGPPEAVIDDAAAFLDRYHRDEIAELAQRYPRDQQSLRVDFGDLYRYDMELAETVRKEPAEAREAFAAALTRADLPAPADLSDATVRFGGVATGTDVYDVGTYPSLLVGTLVGVRGQVNKRSEKREELVTATFRCQRCSATTTIEQDGAELREPHECQGCERQGPFRVDHEASEFREHQVVRLQLPPERANGHSDTSVDVTLTGDLVNAAAPGDRVLADVELQRREARANTEAPLYEFCAEAHDCQVQETDFEDIDVTDAERERIETLASETPFETLTESFAPSLHGLAEEKLAIVLSLFGGVQKTLPDGSTERGDSHVLFVGDPGVGKSALLNFAAQVAPRSIATDGKGSTSAGLTAAAVRDDFGGTEWTLEGGSLVKAHNGVCAIDELDDMDAEDRASLHTALEDQEVRVSKAGISATLPAKTKVIAAANPTNGRFDPYEAVAGQIDLKPTLFSRFDLIFTLVDRPDPERDAEIVGHKLDAAEAGQRAERGDEIDDALQDSVAPAIDADLFRAWIAHARQEVSPCLTADAKDAISEAFLELRQANDDGDDDVQPIPVTFRDAEGIVRLAEASARARLSADVTTDDVERALTLVRRCMRDVGMDPETGKFDIDVVETGTSRKQDQITKQVRTVIAEEERGTDYGAPEAEVIEAATAGDLDRDQVTRALDELSKSGEIYELKQGYYRTT